MNPNATNSGATNCDQCGPTNPDAAGPLPAVLLSRNRSFRTGTLGGCPLELARAQRTSAANKPFVGWLEKSIITAAVWIKTEHLVSQNSGHVLSCSFRSPSERVRHTLTLELKIVMGV
jgi:hypothetical protein